MATAYNSFRALPSALRRLPAMVKKIFRRDQAPARFHKKAHRGTGWPNHSFPSGFWGRAFEGAGSGQSLRDWHASWGSGDADNLYAVDVLRARSRDLYRNTGIAGAMNTIVTHVIGKGLNFQSRIDRKRLDLSDKDADAWEEETESRFQAWASTASCDRSDGDNFYSLQGLSFLSLLLSGDVFALLPIRQRQTGSGLQIQLIEADRVGSPFGVTDDYIQRSSQGKQITQGVEKINGVPTAYYIADEHPGNFGGASYNYKRVAKRGPRSGRRQILHVRRRWRPDQTRGVPILAPVIQLARQQQKYTESEVMASVLASYFTTFITSDNADEPPGGGFDTDGDGIHGSGTYVDPDREYALGSGTSVPLGPGEDVRFAEPKRPNTAYSEFIRAMVEQICMALNFPAEIVMKRFLSSYSASRAALLEAYRVVGEWRQFMVAQFCQPIYEEWLREEILFERIKAPGFDDPYRRWLWSRSEWIGASAGLIDPVKETTAALMRIDGGLSTYANETAAITGQDFEAVARRLKREKDFLENLGLNVSGMPVSIKSKKEMDSADDVDEGDKQEKNDADDAKPE